MTENKNGKVEHINGGNPREFSAIHGEGKKSTGPNVEKPADKEANVGINAGK